MKRTGKKLSLWDGVMMVSGSMIGSGIFIVSAGMSQSIFSPYWLIALWLFTGLLTIAAALSYGELAGMFPKAGGQYVYLKEAYHPIVGFLYGWSFFTVIQTGTIAAVGVAFSKFTGYFIPLFEMKDGNILFHLPLIFTKISIYPAQLLAIFTIVLLTYLNSRSIENGKRIQNLFTSTKLIALFGLLACGLTLGFNHSLWIANWEIGWQNVTMSKEGILSGLVMSSLVGAIATALVGSIFSSDAWNNVTFIASEIDQPEKNIGRSLLLGTLIVTCIYIGMNLMYLGTLSMQQIALAPEERVGVAAAQAIFGPIGTSIIALLIMISTFGCNNGLILSGARVYQTMSQDGLFLPQAARVNDRGIPQWALWAQCIWASLLCLSGKYGDLLNYVVFVVMIFYILTIAGVIVLRRTKPAIVRTYRTPLYPFLPILYILMATGFCIALLCYQPSFTWPGLIIVLLGIPIYYYFQKSVVPKH